MLKVPRERFVPADSAAAAYDNRPLPIGHRQTISQPLIVAAMTQLLHIEPGAHVLEVGTGSGYQTAVLAELAAAGQHDRDRRAARRGRQAGPGRPRLRQHRVPLRRRRRRLAGAGALRWHHRHRRGARDPAGAGRPAQARRSPGDPGRPRRDGPGSPAGREGRRRAGPRAAAVLGGLRAADRGARGALLRTCKPLRLMAGRKAAIFRP